MQCFRCPHYFVQLESPEIPNSKFNLLVKMATAVAPSPLIEMGAFMRLPRKFLATVGISTIVKNHRKQFSLNILFYLSFLNLGLCVLGEIIFCVYSLVRNQSDFIQFTYLILCIGWILLSFAKVIALIAKMGTLHKLTDELSDIFPNTLAEQRDYKVADCWKQTRWILQSYGIVQIFMIVSFSLFPQISTITNYVQHNNWTVEFTYTIWYPMDPYRRGLFEVLYLSQFWAATVSALAILGVDVVMCSIVMLICMHFDHLSLSFLCLKPGKSSEDIALLKKYVIKHNKLIEFVHLRPAMDIHFSKYLFLLQLFQGFGQHFSHHKSIQFGIEFGGDLCGWISVHLLKSNYRSAKICILFDHMHAANLHSVLDGRSSH